MASGAPAVPHYPDLTADRLRASLRGASEIYVSGCSAEIAGLPGLLDAAGVGGTVTGIFNPVLNRRSYASREVDRRCRTFFLNPVFKADLIQGIADFCPWTYTDIAAWCAAPGRFDAAVVMVSPPDGTGRHSLGVQADFLPAFVDRVGMLIGIVNPAMPTTHGSTIAADRFDALFAVDEPLLGTVAGDTQPDPISDAIAAHVAGLVPDGATLQIGIGRIPQAVASALMNHRRLRIHSGLIDDNALRLEEGGALDPDAPIVAGVAIGSRALYDRIDGDPRFRFLPVSHTHGLDVVGAIPRFFAINGTLEVDLFGQINSEVGSGRLIASPGGLPDFMRGARRSDGGMSLVALRAKPGRQGRGGIVAHLDAPGLVSLHRGDIDAVVTENGVALLQGLSLEQRADALIAIADPGEQPRLVEQWRAFRAGALA